MQADQLMAPNFAEDLTHLASHAGKRTPGGPRQTILVSATLTPTILSKATQYCPDPVFITAGAIPAQAAAQAAAPAAGPGSPAWGWGVRGWDGPASPNAPKTVGSAGGVEGESMTPTMPPQLQHYFVVSEPHHKVDMLRRCIWALDAQRSLVFMNFQQRLRDTQFKLQARNMAAGAMHGEMDKLQRWVVAVINHARHCPECDVLACVSMQGMACMVHGDITRPFMKPGVLIE